MGFAERLSVAKAFEDKLHGYLAGRCISVAKNGTEHTHPDFVALLRAKNDLQSKLIRFAPDGVALVRTGGVVHWEAKSGKHIEKDAYETYLRYHDMGCRIVLFVRHPVGRVFWQWVERVGFIPSIDVVSQFPPDKRHPIDDEDWMWPRRGHGYAGAGSGTPYREVDFSSMIEIKDFYENPQATMAL